MDKDTHVYCTKCKHLRFCDEDLPYCPYQDECDNWNFEDSKSFEERPMYEEKENINMNYMEQVAKMIGVELGEEFKLKQCDYIYKLTEEGLVFKCEGTWYFDSTIFKGILIGNEEIERILWKPKLNDLYYYINTDGIMHRTSNWEEHEDIFNLKLKNCFKTKEEITPEIIKKYTDFFNDDERMIDI